VVVVKLFMKLPVPFYKQTTPLNCGPVALKMVLEYLGEEYSTEFLEEATGIKPGKGLGTITLASVSASLGFRTELFSKHLSFNPENLKMDFYKKYSDSDLTSTEQRIREAEKNGAVLKEKLFNLKEILDKINEDCIAIILLDWNVVKGTPEKGYQGHFVPIVGYDDHNIIVHNHGLNNTKDFMHINKEVFDKARTSPGTDEDIIFIYRKN